MSDKSLKLLKDVSAHIDHSCPVKERTEVWRVIVNFVSDAPEKNRIIKHYYVWMTGEFLEDQAQMSADIDSAEQYALKIADKRFKESGNQVPVENGISCSNEEGIVFVNPKEFIHPAEK